MGLITGNTSPDQGEILLEGTPIQNLVPHKRQKSIAMIHQNTALGSVSSMTLLEVIALSAAKGHPFGLQKVLPLSKNRRQNLKQQYQEYLSEMEMGLENCIDHTVSSLSGGQRQALTLLCSLMNTPKLLLLDEHTAALDPKTSERVMVMTDRFIRRNNVTTLMITHDLEQAVQYGDRLLLMESGRMTLDLFGAQKKALQPKDLIHCYYHLEEQAI